MAGEIDGSAEMRGHVLRRDEKGFAGIPLKRLMLGALGGGMVTSLLQGPLGGAAIIPGIVVAVVLLIFTEPYGGVPLYERLVFDVTGLLTLALVRKPGSLLAILAGFLGLQKNVRLVVLDGERLFADVEIDHTATELKDWQFYPDMDAAGKGDSLVLVDGPVSQMISEGSNG